MTVRLCKNACNFVVLIVKGLKEHPDEFAEDTVEKLKVAVGDWSPAV